MPGEDSHVALSLRPILLIATWLPVAESLAQSYLPGEDIHVALSLSPNPIHRSL